MRAGAITTSLVIIIGFAMIFPFFTQVSIEAPHNVLLFFYVENDPEILEWCHNLSTILKEKGIVATIYFTGKVLEQYPEAILSFGEDFDIGSQTYSHTNLSAIDDYTRQLEEIQKGKEIVDTVGNLSSKLFRAPFWETDDNIYSLLSRSAIIADFSYKDHYNKYYNGQFLRFNITSIDGSDISKQSFNHGNSPVIIYFQNKMSVSLISEKLSTLDSSNIKFINASELTGLNLTIRNGETL